MQNTLSEIIRAHRERIESEEIESVEALDPGPSDELLRRLHLFHPERAPREKRVS